MVSDYRLFPFFINALIASNLSILKKRYSVPRLANRKHFTLICRDRNVPIPNTITPKPFLTIGNGVSGWTRAERKSWSLCRKTRMGRRSRAPESVSQLKVSEFSRGSLSRGDHLSFSVRNEWFAACRSQGFVATAASGNLVNCMRAGVARASA